MENSTEGLEDKLEEPLQKNRKEGKQGKKKRKESDQDIQQLGEKKNPEKIYTKKCPRREVAPN